MIAKQCIFKDDDGFTFGGILIDNEYLICGCCGSVFEVDDVTIVQTDNEWFNISDEIKENLLEE